MLCRESHCNAGAASQAMLYFLKQMHNSDRERLERGQVAFDLKAIHIGEAAVTASASPEAVDSVRQQINNSCHKAGVRLYVVPLESVFTPTRELIPIDHDGCCPNMQHLQQDLQRLLQVSSRMVRLKQLMCFTCFSPLCSPHWLQAPDSAHCRSPRYPASSVQFSTTISGVCTACAY